MTQQQRNQLCQNLATIGLLMIAIATAEPLILQPEAFLPGSEIVWYKYLYGAGAVVMLLCRLFTKHQESDLRLRRLLRIENWSAIFFCVGTFFLFYPQAKARDWLAFTLAGAAIMIFTSLMIPLRRSKLAKENHGKENS